MKRVWERFRAIYRLLVHNDQRGTIGEHADAVAKSALRERGETRDMVNSLLEDLTNNFYPPRNPKNDRNDRKA